MSYVHPPTFDLSEEDLRDHLAALVARSFGTSAIIEKSLALATSSHAGQKRRSGEPYIKHPLAVAITVGEMGLDEPTIAAALCHDVIEDCDVSLEELSAALDHEVAFLVNGVTKVDELMYESLEAAAAASAMKMLVHVAEDVRVLLIKLADRWHNMATLSFLPPVKQQRIATETLHIYAPLAQRLGLDELASDLEDLAFSYLHPEQHQALSYAIEQLAPARQEILTRAIGELATALENNGLDALIAARPKGLWSTYSKMTAKQSSLEEVEDLVGVRLIVTTKPECYAALGVVHELWTPRPGAVSDYIAQPKSNGYQSLHTTVIGPRSTSLEVQIRTTQMHEVARRGIAAHFAYKEQRLSSAPEADLSWTRELVEHLDIARAASAPDTGINPSQFFQELRHELVDEELLVLSPKSRVVILPLGSTALDFAFCIHTDVGNHAVGAKINSTLRPLDAPLATGDVIEILTDSDAIPARSWLTSVTTSRARSAIRRRLATLSAEEQVTLAKRELNAALRGAHLQLTPTIEEHLRQAARVESPALLYTAIALGNIDPVRIVQSLLTDSAFCVDLVTHECVSSGVLVAVPSAAGGFTAHRRDCDQVLRAHPVTARVPGRLRATVNVTSLDRSGLLRDCTDALAQLGVSIESTRTGVDANRLSHASYTFYVADETHLATVVEHLSHVEFVISVGVITEATA